MKSACGEGPVPDLEGDTKEFHAEVAPRRGGAGHVASGREAGRRPAGWPQPQDMGLRRIHLGLSVFS